jgi:hypothetical protein
MNNEKMLVILDILIVLILLYMAWAETQFYLGVQQAGSNLQQKLQNNPILAIFGN